MFHNSCISWEKLLFLIKKTPNKFSHTLQEIYAPAMCLYVISLLITIENSRHLMIISRSSFYMLTELLHLNLLSLHHFFLKSTCILHVFIHPCFHIYKLVRVWFSRNKLCVFIFHTLTRWRPMGDDNCGLIFLFDSGSANFCEYIVAEQGI